jgi:aspartyl-tRNA(Asn)/glutamyl-tRNA(Gln) amidotransferase subunit A
MTPPSLAALSAAYADSSLSPADFTDRQLARIEAVEPQIAAFQIIDPAGARQAAAASAERWRRGAALGPLDGATVTIKDNVDVAGFPTRHGSTTTPTTPAVADAPVVARLREAGAVILGKTTLPEFGWMGITHSALRGTPTRNPWDLGRSPGGSSGGAAAALAAGIGCVAFGNDGGGSIRIPASFSGVFGIKPTLGRVPQTNAGVFATLVAGGPLARSVADAALTLAVMARPDDRDWHAVPPPPATWLDNLQPQLARLRIGYAPALGEVEPCAEVARVIKATLDRLRAAGAVIDTLGTLIPPTQSVFASFWIAGFAHRLRAIPRERWGEIDPGYRALAEQGLAVDAETVLEGVEARARLAGVFATLHRSYDVILTPTTPDVAPPVETVYHSADYDRWRAVAYTLPFNLTGQPAASLPAGLTSEGLPVGLQVIGPAYGERLVLEASQAIEQAIDFKDKPSL